SILDPTPPPSPIPTPQPSTQTPPTRTEIDELRLLAIVADLQLAANTVTQLQNQLDEIRDSLQTTYIALLGALLD
ncbi:hypothetical protein DXG01_010895, partial [Tephrocybe rancida]